MKAIKSRPVHLAKLVRKDGGVSPACASKPRKLNLKRSAWTMTVAAVTCGKCLEALGRIG